MSTLAMVRGDTGVWEFTLVDQDGVALDLTGATATFMIKEEVWDAAALIEKTIADGITVTDENGGVLEVRLLPADTEDLPATRTYHWDLEVRYTAQDVYTVDTGLFIINADVGRTVGS